MHNICVDFVYNFANKFCSQICGQKLHAICIQIVDIFCEQILRANHIQSDWLGYCQQHGVFLDGFDLVITIIISTHKLLTKTHNLMSLVK